MDAHGKQPSTIATVQVQSRSSGTDGTTMDMENREDRKNLPETSALSGRFFINLPEAVEDPSYWKIPLFPPSSDPENTSVTPPSEADSSTSPSSPGNLPTTPPPAEDDSRAEGNKNDGWIWRTIGDKFIGSLTRESDGKIQIMSSPSDVSELIQLNPLRRFNPDVTIEELGDVNYTISVTTQNGKDAGTGDRISLKIIGLEGETDFFPIQEGNFLKGQTQIFAQTKLDVGRVIGAEFKTSGEDDDKWEVEKVTIANSRYPNDTAKFNGFSISKSDGLSPTHKTETLKKLNPPKRKIITQEDTEEDFASQFQRFVETGRIGRRALRDAQRIVIQLESDIPVVEDLSLALEVNKELEDLLTTPPPAEDSGTPPDGTSPTPEDPSTTPPTEDSSIEVPLELQEKLKKLNKLDSIFSPDEGIKKIKGLVETLINQRKDEVLDPIRAEIFSIVTLVVADLDGDIRRFDSVDEDSTTEDTTKDALNRFLQALIKTKVDLSGSVDDNKTKFQDFIEAYKNNLNIRPTKEQTAIRNIYPFRERNEQIVKLGQLKDDLDTGYDKLNSVKDSILTVEKTGQYKLKLQEDKDKAAKIISEREKQSSNSDQVFQTFLRGTLQFPVTDTLGQSLDNIGFFGKLVDSSSFEFFVEDIVVKQRGSILPNYGLMIRNSLTPESEYFGLLIVPRSIPDEYSICTFVRRNKVSKPELTGSLNIGKITDVTKLNLKITRAGNLYKGFSNGILVGEEVLKFVKKSAKARSEASSRLNTQTIKTDVYIGVACFPVPRFEVDNTILSDPLSCQLELKEIPTFSSDESISDSRTFALVEYYNLSIFGGHYGAGRTLNTFSLLPGEETEITIKTYKDASTTTESRKTVFEEISEETARDLEKSIEEEQSNASQYEKSMSFHVNATASYSGWGASASISAGYEQNSSSARQQMARSLTNAVDKNATKQSSKRTIEVNSTQTESVETGSSSSVTRRLRNISNSKTVDYIFRQMNQEYISVLHLVDIKVAYIGGGDGTYSEESLGNLETFLKKYIKIDNVDEVMKYIIDRASFILDYNEDPVKVVETVDKTFGNKSFKFDRFQKGDRELIRSTLSPTEPRIFVPGFIIAYSSNIIRTDGIITEARLGEGNAQDSYGNRLEDTDIKEKEAQTRLTNAKASEIETDVEGKKAEGDTIIEQKEAENELTNAKKNLLDVQGKTVQKYLDSVEDFESKKERHIVPGTEEGSFPLWLQRAVGKKENLALSKAFKAGASSLDDFEKVQLENAIHQLETEGARVQHLERRGKSKVEIEKESIENKTALYSGFSELFGSLNLLEPKNLERKGFGLELNKDKTANSGYHDDDNSYGNFYTVMLVVVASVVLSMMMNGFNQA